MYLDLDDFRRVILKKFTFLEEEKIKGKYNWLQDEFGINRYYLWNIINDPDYKPPAWVYAHLGIARYELAPACSSCGKVHAIDRACEMEVIIKEKPKPRKPKRIKKYPRYYAWMFEQMTKVKDWK